ncbi:MAG: tetratricopeptide repeat protein, partial [Verrucomicrobiales bacterium]|nr:tetratricopeptide repeat protein [Verrucomicrobiales bacterium]
MKPDSMRPLLLRIGTAILLVALAGCDRKPPAPAAPSSSSPTQTTASALPPLPSSGPVFEQFLSLMNSGRNHLEQGDAPNAIAVYRRALALAPGDLDLRLNLANAHLLAGDAPAAIAEAEEATRIDPNAAAAHFLMGSARLRLGQLTEAVQSLENANRIEPGVTATLFQLGLARHGLKQWEAAIAVFREGLALDPNRLHSSAHFLLGQCLLRLGRTEEARTELEQHQANVDVGGLEAGRGNFERSKYTQARVPFKLEPPETEGIAVKFVEATDDVFPDGAARRLRGPAGVIDVGNTGWNGLFLAEDGEGGRGFRPWFNEAGTFRPGPTRFPVPGDGTYSKLLVGDL